MNSPLLRVYHDFVDPLSWLLGRELAALGDHVPAAEWIAFELRPPPLPLVTVDDPAVAELWARARSTLETSGLDRPFDPPLLVPWTRKAHELVAYAGTHGSAAAARDRLFEAYLFQARDIGRVDVLVEEAVALGLDRTEAKAVLDVDKHEAVVAEQRARAVEAGILRTPTLTLGERRLEGFHNRAAIRTFLGT